MSAEDQQMKKDFMAGLDNLSHDKIAAMIKAGKLDFSSGSVDPEVFCQLAEQGKNLRLKRLTQ